MIRWCQQHLQPVAPNFEFLHHDVFNYSFNPGDKPLVAPFPVDDREFTLVNAHSVFTHLTEPQAVHYLRECSRILRPDGVLNCSWFFFDKTDFPMMQPFSNALYVAYTDPSAAVIFDKSWVRETARSVGLTICQVVPPAIRGFQWIVTMMPQRTGVEDVEFPPDLAPKGRARPPVGPAEPFKVGL